MKKYLLVDDLLKIHKYLINEFGGTHGLRDLKSLESSVMRPQSGYYQTLFEQAAALMESLLINHPFIDGNKRVAFFATDIFLRMNNHYIECNNELAYGFFMELFERNEMNFKNLLIWIKENNKELKPPGL